MNVLINQETLWNQTQKLQIWIISELPLILILTIALWGLLKVSRYAISKLSITLLKNVEKHENVDSLETEKRINTLTGILTGLIKIILISTYLMIVLQKIGINIAPILASAGIIGLAVGFGAQELVRDIISGFFILLENQVRAGDVAIINGTGGFVEKIALRTITLRDFSGTVHIFQNGKINSLSNMTKEWSAVVLDIGVAYKENVDQVMDIMRTVGEELRADPLFSEKILEPIEVLGVDAFTDSAIIIKVRLKTKPITQWEVGREYRKRLKAAFDLNNIEIPFPHTTLYWGKNETALSNQS
jgi:small conductance mechanosensitive channel